jgi:hypothetical protein
MHWREGQDLGGLNRISQRLRVEQYQVPAVLPHLFPSASDVLANILGASTGGWLTRLPLCTFRELFRNRPHTAQLATGEGRRDSSHNHATDTAYHAAAMADMERYSGSRAASTANVATTTVESARHA